MKRCRVLAVLPVVLTFTIISGCVSVQQSRDVDPQADEVLGAMSRALAGARAFSFSSRDTADELMERGPMGEYASRHEIKVRRPDRVFASDRGTDVVVGIEAILRGKVRFGSLIQLTTLSPRTAEQKSGDFLVVGAFHTGLSDFNLRTVYMPLRAACEFVELFDEHLPDDDGWAMGGWRVSGIGIAIDDYGTRKNDVIKAISRDVIPKYYVRLLRGSRETRFFEAGTLTWEDRKENLLRAVKIEKIIVIIITGLLTVFSGAIIFLILTLNVIEKRRDLGVLKAVGAHDRSVVAIFLIHGGTICIVGLILGFLTGLVFSNNINAIHDCITQVTGLKLFPQDVYYFDRIPVAIKTADLLLITAFTVLFGFLGSLVSAVWAARQDPIQAIHFE